MMLTVWAGRPLVGNCVFGDPEITFFGEFFLTLKPDGPSG
jgi:hypothetical protein